MEGHLHSPKLGCKISKHLITLSKKPLRTISARYCSTCQRDFCRCGYDWGFHPFELDPEYYKKYWKDKCVRCGNDIPMTAKHYNEYGNYCKRCDDISRLSTKDTLGSVEKDCLYNLLINFYGF